MKRLIISVFCALFIFSCNTGINRKIKAAQRKSKNLANKMFLKNDNVFFLNSTYSSTAFVWTYSKETLTLYVISGGKIMNEIQFEYPIDLDWLNDAPIDNIFELDKCLELDGDILMFKVKMEKLIVERRFPVNHDCVRAKEFKSNFINHIAKDMTNYNIGW